MAGNWKLERRSAERGSPQKWDLGRLGCSAQKTESVRGLDGRGQQGGAQLWWDQT